MSTTNQMMLRENLKTLKLPAMVKHLEEKLRHAREGKLDYDEFLLGLTEVELQVRSENRLKRRLSEAKFPLMKSLESFDFDAVPDLNSRLILELSQGEYIKEKRNIIFVGRSGTGKTHLATGLGISACRQGTTTRFVSACGLANELIEARSEKSLNRVMNRYYKYGLVIVDELGYVPFSKEGAELLFQVFAQRHERGSVILTTNLGFGDWTQVFGDATITAALLDRLTHKAHIINCSWQSYRLKQTMKMKNKKDGTFKGR